MHGRGDRGKARQAGPGGRGTPGRLGKRREEREGDSRCVIGAKEEGRRTAPRLKGKGWSKGGTGEPPKTRMRGGKPLRLQRGEVGREPARREEGQTLLWGEGQILRRRLRG